MHIAKPTNGLNTQNPIKIVLKSNPGEIIFTEEKGKGNMIKAIPNSNHFIP